MYRQLSNAIVNLAAALSLVLLSAPNSFAADPLPSWNNGSSKSAITAFVTAVTDKSGAEYVKPSERIAVFDNDGTLWS